MYVCVHDYASLYLSIYLTVCISDDYMSVNERAIMSICEQGAHNINIIYEVGKGSNQ